MATYTCWTRQVSMVADELERLGRTVVSEQHVRDKNQEISDYYLGLYRWLTEGVRAHTNLNIPQDAGFPYWLAMTESQKLPAAPENVTFKLEIPDEHVFLLDYDKWGYRVNYWYVPVDAADEAAHNAELKRLGISNEAQLIMGDKGNFYPALKSKLQRSWNRIFEAPNTNMDNNVGVVWELRSEWVVEVEHYAD